MLQKRGLEGAADSLRACRQRCDVLAPGEVAPEFLHNRKEGTDPELSDSPAELQDLLRWLRANGAEMGGLRFKSKSRGGIGVFAAHSFTAGDVLATLPRHCMLTLGMVKASELGTAVLAAAHEWDCAGLCTDEVLLWVFMCVGRALQSNPFHPYLASLPQVSPEPVCWPKELQAELQSTPVGSAVEAALHQVQVIFDCFVSRLPDHLPHLVPKHCLSIQTLLWARGMLLSRSFASSAFTECNESDSYTASCAYSAKDKDALVKADGHVAAVCLPLFDLLNHRPGQAIMWVLDGSTIRFRTHEHLKCGDEVFNTYGEKPNEDLFLSYGFCLHPNPMDTVRLTLVRDTAAHAGSTPFLTQFVVSRRVNGGVPAELWRALAKPLLGPAKPSPAAEAELEGKGEQVEVGVQQVMMLAELLRSRLLHTKLHTTQMEDMQRLQNATPPTSMYEDMKLFIAMYRQGQREVLQEALSSLAELF